MTATTTMVAITAAMVVWSVGSTPKSSEAINEFNVNAPASPIMMPSVVSINPCLITIATTRDRPAPSAIRMPVFAPIPSPSVSKATVVNPELRQNVRIAWLMSRVTSSSQENIGHAEVQKECHPVIGVIVQ